MRIVVCVAAVPNPEKIKWDRFRQLLDVQDAEPILNPADRGALELAAALAKSTGATFDAICAGTGASAALREAAVFGAQRLIAIVDQSLDAADDSGTAAVLVAALRHADGADVVFCGPITASFGGGTVPGRIAAQLGCEIRVDALAVACVEADLCVDAVGAGAQRQSRVTPPTVIVAAPYGINVRSISPLLLMKAAKRTIESLTLAELGCRLPALAIVDGPFESNRAKRTGEVIEGPDAKARATTLIGALRDRRAI